VAAPPSSNSDDILGESLFSLIDELDLGDCQTAVAAMQPPPPARVPKYTTDIDLTPAALSELDWSAAAGYYSRPRYFPGYHGDLEREHGGDKGHLFRNETLYHKHAFTESTDELIQYLAQAHRDGHTLHECLRGLRLMRPYLDLDATQAKIDKTLYTREEIAAAIVEAFVEETATMLPPSRVGDRVSYVKKHLRVTNSSGPDKLSLHVLCMGCRVPDYWHVKCLLNRVIDRLPSEMHKFVDFTHVSAFCEMRFLGCAKDGRVKRPTRHAINAGGLDPGDYLVQPHDDDPRAGILVWMPEAPPRPALREAASGEPGDGLISQVAAAARKLMPGLSFSDINGQYINFDRASGSWCAICDREHVNDDGKPNVDRPYAMQLDNGSWIFKCRRGDGYLPLDIEQEESAGVGSGSDTDEREPEKMAVPHKAKRKWSDTLEAMLAPRAKSPACLTASQTYSEPKMRAYPRDRRVIAVSAPCATGKSGAGRELIGEYPKHAVVAIAFRRTFAAELCSRGSALGFVDYRDIKGDISLERTPRVVCQYESLCRISLNSLPRQLILVCDEWNSILTQMEANKLGRDRGMCGLVLQMLASQATLVLALDAYLYDATVALLARFTGDSPFVIRNDASIHEGKPVRISPSFEATICEMIERAQAMENAYGTPAFASLGSRFMAAFESVELMLSVEVRLRRVAPRLAIKAYCGETDENVKKRDFTDVHTAWGDVDIILYTCTMEAGNSYERERFDMQFGLFDGKTLLYRSAIQMICRNRCAKEYVIALQYVAPEGPCLLTPEAVRKWACDVDSKLRGQTPGWLQNQLYVDSGQIQLPDTLRVAVWLHNVAERNRSRKHFHKLFLGYLRSWGFWLRIDERALGRMREEPGSVRAERRALEDAKAECKIHRAAALAASPVLDPLALDNLRDKDLKTEEDKAALAAAELRRAYRLGDAPLTSEQVALLSEPGLRRAFENLSFLRGAGGDHASASLTLAALAACSSADNLRTASGGHSVPAARAVAIEAELSSYDGKKARALLAHSVLELLGLVGFGGGISDAYQLPQRELEMLVKQNSRELTERRSGAAKIYGVTTLKPGKEIDTPKAALLFVNAILKATFAMHIQRSRARVGGSRQYSYSLCASAGLQAAGRAGARLPEWDASAEVQPHEPYTLEDVYATLGDA
jgi:hypothetical protein